MSDFKSKFMRGLTIVVVLTILAGGLLIARKPYQRGQALRQQNAELDARIAQKERDIAQLKDNQRRFRTDADFVEQIARQNRRVYPGELVFIFGQDK